MSAKYEIRHVKAMHPYWLFKWPDGRTAYFASPDAAFHRLKTETLRERKERSAYSMCLNIAVNILTVDEYNLVYDLSIIKCKGITKRQYGYLKGIYERQQREF